MTLLSKGHFIGYSKHERFRNNAGISAEENSLKAYRLSEFIFLFILKVGNILCFMLIKCSEQKARFKKSVIMSKLVKIIRMFRIVCWWNRH